MRAADQRINVVIFVPCNSPLPHVVDIYDVDRQAHRSIVGDAASLPQLSCVQHHVVVAVWREPGIHRLRIRRNPRLLVLRRPGEPEYDAEQLHPGIHTDAIDLRRRDPGA